MKKMKKQPEHLKKPGIKKGFETLIMDIIRREALPEEDFYSHN